MATRGGPGPATAPDPVDRESSAVQAVAIFYPVTDPAEPRRLHGEPARRWSTQSFVKAFGPQSTNLAVWAVTGRQMSPIYFVTSNLPPR